MVKKEQFQRQQQDQQESYFSDQKYYPGSEDSQSNSNDSVNFQVDNELYSQEKDSSDDGDLQEEEDSEEVERKLTLLQKQEDRIKQQLKELPYGLLIKQRQQITDEKNKINNKKLDKTKKIAKKNHKNPFETHKNNHKQSQQPKDKHAPKQVSIHQKPHKKHALIFQSSRTKSIDPRFQDYAGHYNQDLAKKTMDFIPKLQEQQIKAIRKTLDQSKGVKKNSRNKKKLTEHERKVLMEQYNKLTNEKRQNQLSQIHKEAKRNIRNQQQQNYSNNNSNRWNGNNNNGGNNERRGYVSKGKLRDEFEKVKQSRMSDEQRKEYLKNKEKKMFRNQQVDRNNMMYETSARFKQRESGNYRGGK